MSESSAHPATHGEDLNKDVSSLPIAGRKKHLHEDMDALRWTREFMENNPNAFRAEIDEGTMLGWFSNAIMCGFDEANRRASARSETPQKPIAWRWRIVSTDEIPWLYATEKPNNLNDELFWDVEPLFAASVPSATPRSVRWVPVAASIAMTRVNEVAIGLDIFGHDQEGQWYRLDGHIEEPK